MIEFAGHVAAQTASNAISGLSGDRHYYWLGSLKTQFKKWLMMLRKNKKAIQET